MQRRSVDTGRKGRASGAWAINVVLGAVLLASSSGLTRSALAQTGPPEQCRSDDGSRPWAEDISESARVRAEALYEEGTALLKELAFAAAVAKYEQSLRLWDHPGIYYNLALAQIGLEQPLNAYRSLHSALRFGGAALKEEECQQALVLRRVLRSQLAEVTISHDQPGTVVKLNGQLLLSGPGQIQRLVSPGEHQLDVTRPGYAPTSETVYLAPGGSRSMVIDRRPPLVSTWVPWLIVSAGLAVGMSGYVLHEQARMDFAAYDSGIFADACPMGCYDDDSKSPTRFLSVARWKQRAGIGGYVLGGSMVLGGAALVYLHQRKALRLHDIGGPGGLTLTPTTTGGDIQLSLSGQF
ncbi:PEGA domain-containing protein [Haliangium sp.]|uniref:PEGA domain-containing protein n=1 Tax=Haliangium sp. TaxID=2663208 RepID=UPI003D0D4D68